MSSWQLPTITEHQTHLPYQLTIPMGSLELQDTHTHLILSQMPLFWGADWVRPGSRSGSTWLCSGNLLTCSVVSLRPPHSLLWHPSPTPLKGVLLGPTACIKRWAGPSQWGVGRDCVCVFFQPLEVRQGLVTITPLVCDPPAPEIGEGGGGAELMGMFVYLFVLDMIN